MANEPDQTLVQIIDTLQLEDNLGVLLAAQLGGTPQEVQLILQATEYDAEKEALRPTAQYIVRALGVVEHKLSIGLFNNMAFSTENPILHRHTKPTVQVYFKGTPPSVDVLMLDLHQLYGQTYGLYRHMAEEINRTRPLGTLLAAGYGLLGEMPLPFAEKVRALLARHNMTTNFIEEEPHHPLMEHQLLVMDDSYLIAQLFTAEPMRIGQQAGKSSASAVE